MTTDRSRYLITADSTREEVLAAVEAWEERSRASAALPRPEFPPVPPDFDGCVLSLDGTAIAMYRPSRPDPVREAQRVAGEEDQSHEGWEPA